MGMIETISDGITRALVWLLGMAFALLLTGGAP